MEIFEFKKNLPIRLNECMLVLSWTDKLTPASQVRDEWSYFIQLQVEPAGWQALWKVPRTICEDLKFQYPTVVFGMVEQVIFKELKAIFTIQAVEEEGIHLPERQKVNLEDLYPTKIQENVELNIEKTAECVDSLRFFYKNLWMPWDFDNDDDLDWTKKHLESRIQFYYDLQKKTINNPLLNHIRNLLHEARYIYSRKKYLEMDLSDDEELADSVYKIKKSIPDLMKMHLRLTIIKNEIELLENPHMRKIYEEIKLNDMDEKENQVETYKVFLVIRPCTVQNHNKVLEMAKELINETTLVHICHTLQNALQICQANNKILLNSGRHSINFFEYLNKKGGIYGLSPPSNNCYNTIISSADNESILFVFDGDFTLKNLRLDCKNIRTGIVIKSGTIKIINCHIIGEKNSCTKQAIHVSGNSSLIIENSQIEHFGLGLKLIDNSSATLRSTIFQECNNAIEINHRNKIYCEKLRICHSKEVGILYESRNFQTNNERLILEEFNEMKNIKIPWVGNCAFEKNFHNIVVYNRKLKTFKQIIEDDSTDESFDFVAHDEMCKDFNHTMEETVKVDF